MSSQDLQSTRTLVSKLNTGKNVNEDSWMTMWCTQNWGELLQPAPLSIALLGSVMIIASSTDDFSLVDPEDPNSYEWKYASHPGSFKASLMQMVTEGYTAFGTAHKDMTRIQNATSQIPDVIKTAVMTIIKGTPREIEAYLPNQIQSVLDLANICVEAAQECESAFTGISNLASEMMVACTYRVGTAEQRLRANEYRLKALEDQKKQQELMVQEAKDQRDTMKNAFLNAETGFHDAVKNVPTGWEIVGMQVVESLTQVAVSAGNAAMGMATLKSQAAMAGIGMLQNVTGTPSGGAANGGAPQQGGALVESYSTLPSKASLSDPALMEAVKVQPFVGALQLLVPGGQNDKPDWDKIRGEGTGTLWIEISLETIKNRLDTTKPMSTQLAPLIDEGISISKAITKVAGSAQSTDDKSLDQYKPRITTLASNLEQLVTKVNLMLNQTGISASGPATPPTPANVSLGAAKLVVESAKFQVDQMRSNLEKSRDSYKAASDQLIKQQEQISKTIASLTSLSLVNNGLKAMLPVLIQAVSAFTTLRSQFFQLTQFFESVASLLADVLKPSVSRWAKDMESTASLAGVQISDLSRQILYTQMMTPLKVSMLSEKISGTYLEVSDKYILPAQRAVGGMMQFTADTSPEGRAKLQARLSTAQKELQQKSDYASKQIRDLVKADQQKFAISIGKRLDQIKTTLEKVMPSVTQPVPKQIADISEKHVQDYTEQKKEAAAENPMFNEDDLM